MAELQHCTHCGEGIPADARFCPRCGTATVAAGADPVVGKVIADRYLILERMGQGASGAIYKAEHTTLRKKVAVKILHIQLSQDESAVERFRREATTVGQIENDHILQVLDFGRTEDKRLFFAMEFLEGRTLADVLREEPKMPIARAIDIIGQIGDALMEAHGLGYVHRDLRPRNVFLTTKRGKADFVKLLDFGLAKLILPSGDQKQTALGMTFGDARYMSPEQARGDAVDRRADIYSLGCIAYEMVAGMPPFVGKTTFEVVQKQLDTPAPRLRAHRPDCPEWLEGIVAKALSKLPDQRFLTVLKLVESVQQQKAPLEPEAEAQRTREMKSPTAQIASIYGPDGRQVSETAPTIPVVKVDDISPEPAKPEPKPEPKAEPKPEPKPVVAKPAPVVAKPAPVEVSAKETQALSTIRPPAPAAASPGGNHKKKDKKQQPKGAGRLTPSVSRSGEIPAVQQSVGATSTGPSVVVEDAAAKRKDDTGEWFSDTEHFSKDAAAGELDEEELYPPKKNRTWLIMGSVAGGLTLIGAIVIFSLPKANKKPLRGEVPEAPAAVAAAPKPSTPPPAPTPVAATPAPEPPKAAPVPLPEKPPVPIPGPPPVEPVQKVAKVEKPAPVEKPAKPVAEKAEKPAVVAAADKSAKPKKLPDGFHDPFAAGATKQATDSTQADFYVKAGRQKLNASDLTGAATNFNKAREFDPRSAEAFAGLGEVAFEQGDYNGAAVNLKQALKISPNRARYFVLLGQAYYKLGRAKDAVAEYKRALKLDPSNAEAQRSLDLAEKKLASGG
jgi:serine/threonine protein kinase